MSTCFRLLKPKMDTLVAALQVVKSPVALVGSGVIARSVERRTQGNDGADDNKDNAARTTNVACNVARGKPGFNDDILNMPWRVRRKAPASVSNKTAAAYPRMSKTTAMIFRELRSGDGCRRM